MKRLLILNVILILLAVAYAPALSAPPLKPEHAIWAKRVRLVWRTHNWAGYSRAEQSKAEKAVLANGKKRAEVELGRMLKKLPLTDPLKFQVAYTMALLNFDYKTSRKILLQYLYEMRVGPPHTSAIDWKRFENADPTAPEGQGAMMGEDMLGLVFDVYEKRKDPLLLSALLEQVPFTDGGAAEVTGECLARIARTHPSDLLKGLDEKSNKIWKTASSHIAVAIDKTPPKEFPGLVKIAKDKHNPLSPKAKRLLKSISET
jgi:hypothetical protein